MEKESERLLGNLLYNNTDKNFIMIKKKYHCEHGRQKYKCKECKGSSLCEHGRQKSQCKECGGSQICKHGRIKSQCKECGGSSICEHGRIKSQCKECGGGSLCKHGGRKSTCKECGGGSICKHGRQKSQCKECGGSSICKHGRIKSRCKECGGGSICKHGRQKPTCKECGGSSICEHGRRKSTCKDCKGGGICKHEKQKSSCNLCATNRNKFCKICDSYLTRRHNKICSGCDDKAYKRTKEYELKEFLETFYDNIIHNKSIKLNNSCKSYRPDFLMDCINFFLIIECDENKHKNYKCEEVRMNNINFQLGLPCIFIRYNPDSKINKITKHRVLKSYIDYYYEKEYINPDVIYLFYINF
jgi:hypothetical protein